MNRKALRIVLLVALAASAVLLLTGCAPGDGTATAAHPASFLWGIWHGWIAPVTLVIGNTGWWYDFGFYLAIVGGFGGLAFFRRRGGRGKDRD